VRVFEVADVAAILEMDVAKVKNWTIGRPLQIGPSVKSAAGSGSRNLYGEDDLYLMALANALSKSGMAANAIKLLIDTLPDDWRQMGILAAYRPGQWRKVKGQSEATKFTYAIGAARELPPGVQSWQMIDVRAIRDWVEGRLRDRD
jgi:hypothetical protein